MITKIKKRKKIKYCKCGCGKEIIIKFHHKYSGIPKYVHGHNNCVNGKRVFSQEVKNKISNTLMGHIVLEKTKKKISKALKANPNVSKNKLGRKHTEESKEKNRQAHLGKKQSRETIEKKIKATKGKKRSLETRKNISNGRKKLWKDPQYRERQIKAVLKASHNCPNKQEIQLQKILDTLFPNIWKFVGNGKLLVNGRNPDFAYIKQKKLIEFFGDYWHKGQNPQKRINIFKRVGWSCVVIWGKEFKNIKKLKNKIIKFMEK